MWFAFCSLTATILAYPVDLLDNPDVAHTMGMQGGSEWRKTLTRRNTSPSC